MIENWKLWSRARDEFVALLEDPKSRESQWQELFTRSPFILTDCLMLGIKPWQLIPCKPGRAEADFYFFPEAKNPSSPYGVIEIKRPGTHILKEPRKDVICLASDTYTAIAQAQKYALDLKAEIVRKLSHQIFIGNALHMFVISGLALEIVQKVITVLHRTQFDRHIPPGLRLVTYDELSDLLTSRIPPRLYLAVPRDPRMKSFRRDFRSPFGIRQLFMSMCSICGRDTEVPFKPIESRPVFCQDCYTNLKKF